MVGSCAEIIRRVGDMIDTRVSRMIEDILQRYTDGLREMVHAEARRLAGELAALQQEMERQKRALAKAQRRITRLNRVATRLGLFDANDQDPDAEPDEGTPWPASSSQGDASYYWQWPPYM